MPEERLLTDNPWHKFTWIEKRKKKIRQFDGDELLDVLNHFEAKFPEVTVAQAAVRTFYWSGCRRKEVVNLKWENLRGDCGEYHFEIVGKAGVEKWFRIPKKLYQELESIRTDSPYVFGAYNDQLRQFYRNSKTPWRGSRITKDFIPENLGGWLYHQIAKWSQGTAYLHVFRKTTLQYARTGEDINRQVADDARVGEGVMMSNYVKETDPEMRQRSNRIYSRLVASLPLEVAESYGYHETKDGALKRQLEAARANEDWELVTQLADKLVQLDRDAG